MELAGVEQLIHALADVQASGSVLALDVRASGSQPICRPNFVLQRSVSEDASSGFFGVAKRLREAAGRPLRRSAAPVCPRWRDQLSLLGTT